MVGCVFFVRTIGEIDTSDVRNVKKLSVKTFWSSLAIRAVEAMQHLRKVESVVKSTSSPPINMDYYASMSPDEIRSKFCQFLSIICKNECHFRSHFHARQFRIRSCHESQVSSVRDGRNSVLDVAGPHRCVSYFRLSK